MAIQLLLDFRAKEFLCEFKRYYDMNKKNQQINFIIDSVGLILIGLLSLGYCLFSSSFAETRLIFSFLNFPVFVGEILLFLCLILLIIKWKINHQKFNIWYYLIFCYFGFVLLKTFLGYSKWGPLAIRHSALFYYPLFALLGCNFYRRDFFKDKKILFLVLLLISILKFIPFYNYFLLTCIILTFILVKAYPSKTLRNIFICLLLISTSYKSFFHSARTILVGNLATGIYIAITSFFILRLKTYHRIIISVLSVAFILFGVLRLADSNAVKSLVSPKIALNLYNKYSKDVIETEKDFKMMEIREVKLYNPGVGLVKKIQVQMIGKAQAKMEEAQAKMEEAQARIKEIQADELEAKGVRQAKIPSKRNLRTAYGNIIFRIFIWQDMLSALGKEKPFLGFEFGRPFRSKRLEMLGWGASEWKRDGWIAAHNSYLEMIYRAGFVGILFIITIFIVLFKMIKNSIKQKSIAGVLLCGILVNWLVMANFAVILELPYNAIPFWSLFGMTFAHLSKLQNN